MVTDGNDGISDMEWEHRVLCSDESCIGVIGPDGHCKECGLKYEGQLPSTFENGETTDPEESNSAELVEGDGHDERDHQGSAETDADDEWSNRKLCSDESCIGVIGPDGRCKECGLAYTPED